MQHEDKPTSCFVYRSCRRAETYLWLAARDDFERVPAALREALGRLEFALEVALTPTRLLARADAIQVLASLDERGYYLQMPPPDTPMP